MHRKLRFPPGLTPGDLDLARRHGSSRRRKVRAARFLKRRRHRFQRRALRRLDDFTDPEPVVSIPVRQARPVPDQRRRFDKPRWTFLQIGPSSWAVVYLDTLR